MREEVLMLSRKVFGLEDDLTLRAICSLATSYAATGRQDEALRMREEVLPLCRKVLGWEHLLTLTAMNHLALSYAATGRQDEALKMREEVLTLERKILGPEHPDTLGTMNQLAISYIAAGRQDETLEMLEDVLTLRRKFLAPEHPDTLSAITNLAISYAAAGRKNEAISLREEFAESEPDRWDNWNDLGFLYDPLGKHDQAIAAWRKAIEIDPNIKTAAPYYLGVLLEQSGKADEAFTAYLLAIRNGVMWREAKEKIQGILEDPQNLEDCLRAVKSNPDLKLAAFTSFASFGRAGAVRSLLADFSVRKSEETMLAMQAAALQAWFGQTDEYHGFRQRTLAWAADTEDSAVAERVAKLACLRPIEDAALQAAVVALATRAVDLGKDDKAFFP